MLYVWLVSVGTNGILPCMQINLCGADCGWKNSLDSGNSLDFWITKPVNLFHLMHRSSLNYVVLNSMHWVFWKPPWSLIGDSGPCSNYRRGQSSKLFVLFLAFSASTFKLPTIRVRTSPLSKPPPLSAYTRHFPCAILDQLSSSASPDAHRRYIHQVFPQSF